MPLANCMICKLLCLNLWLSRITQALNCTVPLFPFQFSVFLPKSSKLLTCKHFFLNIYSRINAVKKTVPIFKNVITVWFHVKSVGKQVVQLREILLQFFINIQQCMDFCRWLLKNTVVVWKLTLLSSVVLKLKWLWKVMMMLSKIKNILLFLLQLEITSVFDKLLLW